MFETACSIEESHKLTGAKPPTAIDAPPRPAPWQTAGRWQKDYLISLGSLDSREHLQETPIIYGKNVKTHGFRFDEFPLNPMILQMILQI
jgi:hypothetical protein